MAKYTYLKLRLIALTLVVGICTMPLTFSTAAQAFSDNKSGQLNNRYPEFLWKAMETSNYPVLIEHLPEYANNGDQTAQIILGTLYLNGSGVKKDIELSKKWFLKAVPSSYGDAEYYLGLICESKKSRVEVDVPCAVSWYEKAHSKGNSDATFRLAMVLAYGGDDRIPFEEAMKRSYDLLASFKNSKSYSTNVSFNLIFGLMNVAPVEMDQNLELGIHHLRKAASLNSLDALIILDVMHDMGILSQSDPLITPDFDEQAVQAIGLDQFEKKKADYRVVLSSETDESADQ